MVLIEFLARAEGPLAYKIQHFRLGQGLAMASPAWHFRDVEDPLECIVQDPDLLDELLVKVPSGQHRASELPQHLRRKRTSSPKPVVFLGLVAVVPTTDNLPGKTLKVIGDVTVRGVLHGIVCSELLHGEVREAVDAVKDPERYQGLHRVRIELGEANVQI